MKPEKGTELHVQSDQLDQLARSLDRIHTRLDDLETRLPDPSTDPPAGATGPSAAASDLITGPFTRALSKLSADEDDPGINYRPETYSQCNVKHKSRDHNKMDTLDLMYGWICVADHMNSLGEDITSYLRHIKYTVQMLHSRQCWDSAAVKYDRDIIDRFVNKVRRNFDPDPVISSISFSPRVIPETVEICHGGSLTKGVRSMPVSRTPQKRRKGQPFSSNMEVPPDFPDHICFFYNYRNCNEENCTKSHVCRKCNGKHRADSCRERTRPA